MLGIIFGLVLGAVELWLLKKLTDGVTAGGNLPIWTIPVNIIALPAFLLPVALLKRGDLPYAGIAAAGFLIIGSLILFMKKQRAERGGK